MAPSVIPSTTTQQLAVLGGCVILYFILVSIYRLTLHPLAEYPGRFLSKISGFAVYLQAITGDRHLVHLKEHEKYGPIVRIAPNQLSFASPSALRQIYQSSRQNNPLRKSPWYETIDAPSGAYSTHSEVSRTKHAWRRRVLDHAFSDSSLRSAETFMIENANDFCKVIGRTTKLGEWSEPHNVRNLCTWLSYDIMGDLVFGQRFECLASPEHRFVPKLLMSASAFIYPIAYLPFQSLVRPLISSPSLMNWFGGQLARDEHAYVSYAHDRVTECLAMESTSSSGKTPRTDTSLPSSAPRRDMMHHMITSRDPITGKPFTRSDLDAESSLLIGAGTDTISITLAAAFFYLTLPSSLPMLTFSQSQLRSQYPSIDAMIYPSITQHTYLRAIIDEALRLAPPVPAHLPRTIVTSPGLTIDKHLIPKGTIVGCSAYVLHHDETAYPDSFSFRPERWIPHPTGSRADNKAELTATHLDAPSPLQDPAQVSLAKEAFTPFSLGSRGCVGKSLAYIELSVCLGRMLWMYDIRRSSQPNDEDGRVSIKSQREKRGWKVRDDEYQLRDCFVAEREGPWIEFRLWEGGVRQ